MHRVLRYTRNPPSYEVCEGHPLPHPPSPASAAAPATPPPMRVFVVNLPSRPEKWGAFQEHARRNARSRTLFRFERFDACVGSEAIQDLPHCPIKPGELGCMRSHQWIWQKCLDENLPYVFIAEDDVRFPDVYAWDRAEQSILRDLPATVDSWDIVYLSRQEDMRNAMELGMLRGLPSPFGTHPAPTQVLGSYVVPMSPRCGTHFYVASQEGCRKMLAACREVRAPVDLQLWFTPTPLRSYSLQKDCLLCEHENCSDTVCTNEAVRLMAKPVTPGGDTLDPPPSPALQEVWIALRDKNYPFYYETLSEQVHAVTTSAAAPCDPRLAEHLRGLLEARAGNTAAAAAHLERAQQGKPRDPLLWTDIGLWHQQQERYLPSLEAFLHARALSPHAPEPHLGILRVLKKDCSDLRVVDRYLQEEVLAKEIEHPEVWEFMAELYEQVRDLERACKYRQKCYTADPNHAEKRLRLAQIVLKSQTPLDGVALLEQNVLHHPHHIPSYLLLAKYYHDTEARFLSLHWIQRATILFEAAFASASGESLPTLDMLRLAFQAASQWMDAGDLAQARAWLDKLRPFLDPRHPERPSHEAMRCDAAVLKKLRFEYLMFCGHFCQYAQEIDEARSVFAFVYAHAAELATSVCDWHNIQTRRGMLELLANPRHDFATQSFLYSQMYSQCYHATLNYHRAYQLRSWQGEPTRGLYVINTSGMGDAFMCARFFPLLRARGIQDIYFVVHEELHHLFEKASFARDVHLVSNVEFFTGRYMPKAHARDRAHVPFYSDVLALPGALGLSYEEAMAVPAEYLPRDAMPSLPLFLQRQLATPYRKRHRVFLQWKSNRTNCLAAVRDISLAALAPLFALPGIDWFVTRFDLTEEEYRVLVRYPHVRVLPRIDFQKRAFEDTIPFLARMDDIVTVDTSLPHLAGSLGLPCRVLLWSVPEWRWALEGSTVAWYPKATLYRQRTYGDWTHPVAQLAADLQRSCVAS